MAPKRFFGPRSKKSSEIMMKSNAKYLLIVESPSKCKKIEGFLGEAYMCIASMGHIRHISGLKSINTKNDYEIKFDFIEDKKTHIEMMRKIIQKFNPQNIFLASDDDREGESIAWHIASVFELPIDSTKRIIFHEITESAIKTAVEKPRLINMNIVKAQHARQVLDLLVGFKISPLLWRYMYNNKDNGLSAGRCQTPALRLVYDNEMEIRANPPLYKYRVFANFMGKLTIDMDLNRIFDIPSEAYSFLEKSRKWPHMLTLSSKKQSIRSAPKPFNTSTLLQTASDKLGCGAKETMALAQQLYQEGLITYMRTDSQTYASAFLDIIDKYIVKTFGDSYVVKREDSVDSTEISLPHEAIRVTHIDCASINTENRRLNSLYRLIWIHTLETCMPDAKYETTSLYISAPDNNKYTHNIEIPIFLGWQRITQTEEELQKQQEILGGNLLYYKTVENANKPVSYDRIRTEVVVRGRHSHYTEASLIKKLEDLGIGRPSTFALLVSTIEERGYVSKRNVEGKTIISEEYCLTKGKDEISTVKLEKVVGQEHNKLCIEPVGIMILEFLVKHFDGLFSYDYTKSMEDQLTSEEMSEPWYKICKECNTEIKKLIKDATENLAKESFALADTDEYRVVFNKYGAVLRRKNPENDEEYLAIRKGIQLDLEKLRGGKYSLAELLPNKDLTYGDYEGEEIIIKSGPYGEYIMCGEHKISMKDFPEGKEKTRTTIIEHIVSKTSQSEEVDENILMKISDCASLRKGKYGAYVYYKTEKMKKPEFFNIKKYKGAMEKESLKAWLKETYRINI